MPYIVICFDISLLATTENGFKDSALKSLTLKAKTFSESQEEIAGIFYVKPRLKLKTYFKL